MSRGPYVLRVSYSDGAIRMVVGYAGLKSGNLDMVDVPLKTATRIGAELAHAIHMAVQAKAPLA